MTLSNKKWLLRRIKPNKEAHHDTVIYTGSLKGKSKGFRVIRQVHDNKAGIANDCCL